MFSTIIYILIALLLYGSAGVFDLSMELGLQDFFLAALFAMLFWLVCKFSFARLKTRDSMGEITNPDRTISFLSLTALILFAVDIYILRLPLLLESFGIFTKIPTTGSLIFMGIFIAYLFMIWSQAYNQQKNHFSWQVSRQDFLLSNLSFALPTLIPWVCLSLFFDLTRLLPFPALKSALESPAGSGIVLALFVIFMSLSAPVLIQRIWKCSPLQPGPERAFIEQICKNQGLEFRDILQWNIFGGSMLTAGIMGITKKFRYILVAPALSTHLTPHELKAVILHEIGHARRGHPVFYVLLFSGFISATYLLFEPVMLLLYLATPVYKAFAFLGIDKTNGHAFMIVALLIAGTGLYFRFGFGYVMRNCERQADLYLFDASWNPAHLISAFCKIIMVSGQSPERPSWHHFSIGQRVRFIEQCLIHPEKISAHHKKVRKIFTGFLSLFLLLSFVGYQISYGSWEQTFSDYVTVKILIQQVKEHPDPDLYLLLADTCYEKKSFANAAAAYENVLKIDQNNSHALNNLAWLLLTCPDPAVKNPKKALELSSLAVTTSMAPHVWDTHALALSENKFHEQALNAAQKALNLHLSSGPESQTVYYQNQVEKFEQIYLEKNKKLKNRTPESEP